MCVCVCVSVSVSVSVFVLFVDTCIFFMKYILSFVLLVRFNNKHSLAA